MKKINKSSELLWLLGLVFVALGVAICSKADLGVSMIAAPCFVLNEAISPLWNGFSVGMAEYLFQGIMLIILCIAVRRLNIRYLLSFAVAVIYGYTLDLFLFLLAPVSFDTVAVRWIMLLVGDTCTAFGVACFFKTYLPLQVYELFVSEVSDRFKLSINKTKWAFDMTLLVISSALAFVLFGDAKSFDWSSIGYSSFHSIGLGTLVTTLINSPIIAFMSRMVDKLFKPDARFELLQKALK